MPAFPEATLTPEEIADVTAGDLLDGPWQIELRGVKMDGADCDTNLVVSSFLDGFGVPSGRNLDEFRPMRHGVFASPQFLGGRTMTCEVVVQADTLADFMDAMQDLARAWAPVSIHDSDLTIPLAFTLADTTKYLVWGKPMRAEARYATLARVYPEKAFSDATVCEFFATDPRIYVLTIDAASLGIGTSSGGHGFPLGFPHGFGMASSGSSDCVNAGNIETYPTITVTPGPAGASGIEIINQTTGKTWATSLVLGADEWLVIDMGERTAKLNGTADRSTYTIRPPSEFFALEPGTNLLTLNATGNGTTARVEWRAAYLM